MDSAQPAPAAPTALDAKRLAEWHAAHAVRLRAFVYGVVKDWSAADDLIQVTFLKALSHGGNVQPGAERAWLYQVALNEALQWKRSQRRASGQQARHAASNPNNAPLAPEVLLQQRETYETLRRAVASLPEEQRVIVERRLAQQQTFQEISVELHTPLGTVLTRMRLALEKLRRLLPESP